VGDGIVAILVSDGLCMMMGADADAKHPGESCVQGEDPADDTVADDTAIEVDDSELPF